MSPSAWPTEVYGFKVTREQTGSAGRLLKPVVIVHHTTETDGPVGSYPNPPHFEVSSTKIRQFRSLDEWAAALRHSDRAPYSPNAHAVQIEIVCRSKQARYTPPKPEMDRVAALDAYISGYHDVPLVVPNNWPDDCSDMPLPWAAENSRRKWAAKANGNLHNFPSVRGVWEHKEVPWQDPSWHWDCGAMSRSAILARAKELLDGGPPEKTPSSAVRTATPPPWPGRNLKLTTPYTKGEDVRAWQRQLKSRGCRIDVDGVFGKQTDEVTRAFQRQNHLIFDGIVGPVTWAQAGT